MASLDKLISSRAKQFQGEITLPGDKSISHRAVILTSLGQGEARIRHFLPAADCHSSAQAFQAMGVEMEFLSEEEVVVKGKGKKALKKPDKILDLGNSGTTARLLTGVLAGQPFSAEITGDESLCSRPMKRVVEPLTQMGAQFSGRADSLPLKVQGGPLKGMTHTLQVASAQVKSSLLLAGMYAEGSTTVVESIPTRNHTEQMLQYLGVDLKIEGNAITIKGEAQPQNRDITIPGDISSAAFLITGAALFPKSHLVVRRVGLNPTRTAFLDILKKMGAQIKITPDPQEKGEPFGDIEVQGGELKGTQISGKVIPGLIDEIPILAVAAALAHGKTEIRNAEELRVKESDRIKTLTQSLRQLGVNVEELPDGMVIVGPTAFKGGITLSSFGDHRIAMSLAIAGLFCQEPIAIEEARCIETSFPQFPQCLKSVVKHA